MGTQLGVVAVVGCLAVAACGSTGAASTASSTKSATSVAPALQVKFRELTPGSDSAAMIDYSAIVQAGRVRLTIVLYPDESGTNPAPDKQLIYDGSRLLVHDEENVIPYQVFEDAAHARTGTEPALSRIAAYLPFDPASAVTQWLCPGAKKVLDGKNLGREAVRYSCAARNGGPSAVWVDKAFGIVLGPQVPSGAQFVADPPVDSATFATTPPAGARSEVIGAAPKRGGTAPAFTVTEVPRVGSPSEQAGGKPIASSEFAGHPYVLAFFDEGVLFGGDGPEANSLRELSNLTYGGTKPAVLGVVVTSADAVDKGGMFKSKGWAFRVAYDDTRVQHQFGFTDQLGFVFIDSDGTISTTQSSVMSRNDLQKALAGLR